MLLKKRWEAVGVAEMREGTWGYGKPGLWGCDVREYEIAGVTHLFKKRSFHVLMSEEVVDGQ